MIGLEYILTQYKTNANKLAKELGISRYTVYDWLKERREIPEIRLEQLSKLFKLPKEYFISKNLKQSEMIDIQRTYIQINATFEEYEDIIVDDEGNEYTVKKHYSPEQQIDDFLFEEQQIYNLLENVESIIRNDDGFDNFGLINSVISIIHSGNTNKWLMLDQTIKYLLYHSDESKGWTAMDEKVIRKFNEIFELIKKQK